MGALPKMIKRTKVAITLDTDWASDEVLDHAMALLLKYKVKATWFITHDSSVIRKLFSYRSLFEIGIHPNFLLNSTQGPTMDKVMLDLLTIYPAAKIMRTHSLYQSTPMFETIIKRYSNIRIDVSLFLPYEKHVRPHKYHTIVGNKNPYIMRIPYVWEDDMELCLPKPDFKFSIERFGGTGIKIFDFHPIHIALNSVAVDSYDILKDRCSGSISKIKLKDVFKFRQTKSVGVEDFLTGLLKSKRTRFTHIAEEIGA
jgi:hypothetical protein